MEKSRKILHLMHESIFTKNFINFIQSESIVGHHKFFIRKKHADQRKSPNQNKSYFSFNFFGVLKHLFKIYIELKKTDKVFLHSFQDPRFIIIFTILFNKLDKIYWVVWGGDLYSFNSLPWYTKFIKKKLIQKFGGIIVLVDGDGDLARQTFKLATDFDIQQCMFYLSTMLYKKKLQVSDNELNFNLETNDINILLGNSGDPTNKHKEVLLWLSGIKKQTQLNFKVFCILSYGGSEIYKQEIQDLGKTHFNNDFVCLTKFIAVEEYNYFLNKMDVAIFAMQRQQALGNIVTLLEGGTTVFLNKSSPTCDWLSSKNIYFKNYQSENIALLTEHQKNHNVSFFNKYNSVNEHKKELSRFFE